MCASRNHPVGCVLARTVQAHTLTTVFFALMNGLPMLRLIPALLLSLMMCLPATAQDAPDRSATGGAQTLEDIMARQRGETIDDSFRRDNVGDPNSAAAIANQLGTLGGTSDPELWRALRYGSADVTSSTNDELGKVLVQPGGMNWLEFREGTLRTFGTNILLLTILGLGLFYMLRDRIRIDDPKTGTTVTRLSSCNSHGGTTVCRTPETISANGRGNCGALSLNA